MVKILDINMMIIKNLSIERLLLNHLYNEFRMSQFIRYRTLRILIICVNNEKSKMEYLIATLYILTIIYCFSAWDILGWTSGESYTSKDQKTNQI